jgi:hypothetical protein
MKLKTGILSALALLLVAAGVFAAQIQGSVQGFSCVTQDKTCPVDQEDPVIATERVFVVLTADGDYYFVPNLDRAIMARHLREEVRVTGEINEKYDSIQAKKFEVRQNGKWKVTWSKEMEEEWRRKMQLGT